MNWMPVRSIVRRQLQRGTKGNRFVCCATFTGCFVLSLCGCATRESDGQQAPESVGLAAQKVQIQGAPTADAVVLRHAGSGYEVELQSPKGFPSRAFPPVLRIGEAAFRKNHSSSTIGDFAIVFELSASEFDALPDGSDISLAYVHEPVGAQAFGAKDKRRGAPGKSFGALDKSKLQH